MPLNYRKQKWIKEEEQDQEALRGGAGKGIAFILFEEWILRVPDIPIWVCIKCIPESRLCIYNLLIIHLGRLCTSK